MSAAAMGSNVDASFDDEELVALCLVGHEGASAGLAGWLRRLAHCLLVSRSVWSPADMDDLVQEVLAILLADDRRLLRAYTPPSCPTDHLSDGHPAPLRKQSREIVPDHPSPDFVPATSDPEAQQVNEIWWSEPCHSLDVLILRYTVLGYQADEIAALLSYRRRMKESF